MKLFKPLTLSPSKINYVITSVSDESEEWEVDRKAIDIETAKYIAYGFYTEDYDPTLIMEMSIMLDDKETPLIVVIGDSPQTTKIGVAI